MAQEFVLKFKKSSYDVQLLRRLNVLLLLMLAVMTMMSGAGGWLLQHQVRRIDVELRRRRGTIAGMDIL
jgi:hypothetical protein